MDTPFRRKPHTSVEELGRGGQGNGLNIGHLLQLPQTLNLSAWHLHRLRCRFVGKHLACKLLRMPVPQNFVTDSF
jgi:hypothetical protein